MAAKRPPQKTPLKKPVATPAMRPAGGESVVRRNNVAAQPSPVELRAEREPAVKMALGQRKDMYAETADWAPPPHQMSWWERVKIAVRGEKSHQGENLAEQMAVVKAGVLQELETMGAKKGVAVKGSPFSTVMLPVAKPKRDWKWPLAGAGVLALVALLVWVASKPATPEAVLGQAIAAVRNNDVRTFEAKVDVAGVATSVVNQMFNVPENADNPLAARMAAFVKPGLAESLKDEILAAVGGEKLDDSGNTLLGRVWHAAGGEKMRFGSARVAMQDPHLAVAELPLMRTDLGLTLPLQVVLTRSSPDDDTWQVVDLPNLAAVLESVTGAERALAERRGPGHPAAIRIEDVRKAKGDGGDNLMVSMALANSGASDVRDVPLEIAFGDAAGQPMMATRVTLDGLLPAGTRREQVWSIPINRGRAVERYVADLPLSALTVQVRVLP